MFLGRKYRHTPGPWETVKDGYHLHVRKAGYAEPFLAYLPLVNATFRGTKGDRPEEEANARLIASAPRLLLALARLVALDNTNTDPGTDDYRAAVAEAKVALDEATNGAPFGEKE